MSDTKQRSVIVIGGGPGGYVAAIRASQLGAKVTLANRERTSRGHLSERWVHS